MKTKEFRPYVRLANGREKTTSWRIAIRLSFYRVLKKPFYVMVQHGFPNHALDCAATKRELMQSPLPVSCKQMSFRRWTYRMQHFATYGKGGTLEL